MRHNLATPDAFTIVVKVKKKTLDCEMLSLHDTLLVVLTKFASVAWSTEAMVLGLRDFACSLRFLQPEQNFFNLLVIVLKPTVLSPFTNVFGRFCSIMALFKLVKHKFSN